MNILFCSAGRRVQLLKFMKESLGEQCFIVAVDNSPIAPALYVADKHYVVPRITENNYIERILEICHKNHIQAITTLIDPEIEVLAANKDLFISEGILPLCPTKETAALCFDKYAFFCYLQANGIPTVLTYDSLSAFNKGRQQGKINFPVFIKPKTGSGSVGIHRVDNMETLERLLRTESYNYIIQELMTEGDCDADVYIDCITHKPVAAFSKRKIETKIGGASKTISFKDSLLFEFIEKICTVFEFNGPVDMDFWYKDGQYLLSEVNPRFGGAYLHAYGAGVDFFKLIMNNIQGKSNLSQIGNYDEDLLMMMYDSVVFVKKNELGQ